mmetsp:Transcript_29987/g.51218  ORF Transcript_29987/g.51218 Transcript_29987/m.51218 type:complete len:219 (+) Transcript_29987:556-1212(+)
MMKGEDKLSRNPTSRSGSKTVGSALSGADAVGGVAISVVGDDVTVASSVGDTAGVLTDCVPIPNICTAPAAGDAFAVPIHVDAPTTSEEPSLDRDTDEPKLAPLIDKNLSPRGNTSLSTRLSRSQTRATPVSPKSNICPPLPPQATLFPSAEIEADQPSSSRLFFPTIVLSSTYSPVPVRSKILQRPIAGVSPPSFVNPLPPTTNKLPSLDNATDDPS